MRPRGPTTSLGLRTDLKVLRVHDNGIFLRVMYLVRVGLSRFPLERVPFAFHSTTFNTPTDGETCNPCLSWSPFSVACYWGLGIGAREKWHAVTAYCGVYTD